MFNPLRQWFGVRTSRTQRRSKTWKKKRVLLHAELLEDRLAPAVYNVVSTADNLHAVTKTGPGVFQAPSLRSAIQAANANAGGNTINLTVAGTYRITLAGTPGETDNDAGEFAILPGGGNLAIQNTSGGTAIVDGNHLNRVFDINPNDTGTQFTVTFKGFTVQNGIAAPGDAAGGSGGGIRDQGPVSLTLTNMVIANNVATADGGGVSMENVVSSPWTLTMNNTVVTGNHAGDAGGGVETDGSGKVFINGGTISNNTSVNQGAGIWLDAILASNGTVGSATVTAGGTGYGTAPTVTINDPTGTGATGFATIANGSVINVTITNGGTGYTAPTISFSGGGGSGAAATANLAVLQSANLTVMGALITNNKALSTVSGVGGGIGNAGNGAVTIVTSTISSNSAGGVGGGFSDQNNQGTLVVVGSYFLNNVAAGNGGAIQEGGPQTGITNSQIQGNASAGVGGGVFVAGRTLFLQSSTIANNVSASNGGGIELATTGAGLNASTITDTTITGNLALNNADVSGGGIDAEESGDLALLNDTINANFAGNGGGVFWAGTGVFKVQNTIIAADTIAGDGIGVDANNPSGTFTDSGGNLIGVSGAGGGNTGFTATTTKTGTVASPLNPLLEALANNGGPTVGAPGATLVLQTEALFVGSPAFGNGILFGAPPDDERGVASVVNGKINIGAASNVPAVAPQGPVSKTFSPLVSTSGGTTVYNVNSTADLLTPPHGVLTLRAAIKAANAHPGNNIINLTVAGDYKITLAGTPGETDNAAGEFAILPPGGSVASSLTIQNTSGGAVTVDGNHLNRVFDINPNNTNVTPKFTVTLSGFTVSNGVASPGDAAGGSGGGIRDQGNVSLTLGHMTLSNNIATADGGGISMENAPASTSWTLTINSSTISDNHAGDAGGGIETDGKGKVFINTGTVITGNSTVNQGAGVWLDAVADGVASVTITNPGTGYTTAPTVTFSAPQNAGGTTATGTATITGGVVTFVTITNPGSGYTAAPTVTFAPPPAGITATGSANLGFNSGATLSMTGVLVVGNTAFNGPTGAIGNAGNGAVTITNCTVANNFSGTTGGGFGDANNLGTLTVTNSLFLNNMAVGNGGAIEEGGPATTITDTEIKANASGASGAAVFANGTTIIIHNATVANNTAAANGGGIEIETTGTGAGASTIINATITGNLALNNAGVSGGGIDASSNFTGTLTLLNDTINANFADSGGGVFWAGTGGSTFNVQNTIIAKNSASTTGPDANNPAGTFTDNGGNLIGLGGAANGNTGFTAASTQTGTTVPLDPLLGPLQDNGGPIIGEPGDSIVLQTEALLDGSKAIGKGVAKGAPTSDERGQPRPDTAGERPDIGAFEVQDSSHS